MKRMLFAVLAVGCLTILAAATAPAQAIRWGVGAGVLLPMGEYGDFDKMGFTGGVGGSSQLRGGLAIRADVSYGRTNEKSGGTPHTTTLLGGMASLVYSFGASAGARPYLMGGVGMYNVKVDAGGLSSSETKAAFGFGGGVSLPMGTGGSRLFAETRYTGVSTRGFSTAFLPVIVGISFGQ